MVDIRIRALVFFFFFLRSSDLYKNTGGFPGQFPVISCINSWPVKRRGSLTASEPRVGIKPRWNYARVEVRAAPACLVSIWKSRFLLRVFIFSAGSYQPCWQKILGADCCSTENLPHPDARLNLITNAHIKLCFSNNLYVVFCVLSPNFFTSAFVQDNSF